MQSFQGRPLLINFWATWCPPCIEELPLIETFYQENKAKSWQVLGLAVDNAERVQSFLQANKLSFPIGMAGLEGTQLSRELGNVGGGLPFTVVFSSDGQIAQRKLGRLQVQDLEQWRGLT
jgi:thiol-disulfide isomerase/thioredoxin